VKRRPDVLLVVGDCVGYDVSELGWGSRPALPTLAGLKEAGVSCARAISPSSWTLPAHASLFTGRYPWETGVTRSDSRLGSGEPTIAEAAREAGYATSCFSSNPFVCEANGMTRGFGVARWGSFEEVAFRRPCPQAGRHRRATPVAVAPKSRVIAAGALGTLVRRGARAFPPALDVPVRVWNRIASLPGEAQPVVSSWIEREFGSWARAVPRDQPIFCFVNLMDAHEPYVGLTTGPQSRIPLTLHWRAYRISMSNSKRIADGIRAEDLRTLRALYQTSVQIVDRRVGGLLAELERSRGSQNCWVVFLGDHGQVFGEDHNLFHGGGLSTGLFHVPLVVRPPEGLKGGQLERGRVSTRRVAVLLRSVFSGLDLDTLSVRAALLEPEGPTWALADVFVAREGSPVAGRRRGGNPTQRLVAFTDEAKFVLDPSSGRLLEAYRVPSGEKCVPEAFRGSTQGFQDYAAKAGHSLTLSTNEGAGESVVQRLRDWGYE
jgi:arylsulfatase A-like enzyme